MNKVGSIYTMILGITVLIAFAAFAFSMITASSKHADYVIGKSASDLQQIYNEGERIKLYLETSTRYAFMNSIGQLIENGGAMPNTRSCKHLTIEQQNYLVWGSCDLRITEDALNLTNSSLNHYTKYYTSLNPLPPELNRQIIMDNKVQSTSIKSYILEEDTITIIFENITTIVPGNPGSFYTINPITVLEKPDFSTVDKLSKIIKLKCNSPDTCVRALSSTFPSSKLKRYGKYTILELPYYSSTLRIAIPHTQ